MSRLLAAALVWIAVTASCARPFGRDSAMPPGWHLWKEPGATFAIAPTSDGLYAGGMDGLWLIRGESAAEVRLPRTRKPIVFALLVDSRHRLWVGHSQGFSVLGDSGWQTVRESDGLPHHSISAVAEASDGALWLGTPNGVVRAAAQGPWNRDTLKLVTPHDGLLTAAVLTVVADGEGGVWFGHYGASGGVSRFEGGRWTHWTVQDGLPHPNVNALALARDGAVWAGCGLNDRGGVAVFRRRPLGWSLDARLSGRDLAGPHGRSVYEDSRGRMWIGSETDGLAIRDGTATVAVMTEADGLPAGEVTVIVEDTEGAMWLGTRQGPLRLAQTAVERVAGAATKPVSRE